MNETTLSQTSLYTRACQCMPGGVSSPVRAFGLIGQPPLIIQRGEGPYLIDTTGRAYIDYVGAFGPIIVGHAHPYVLARVQQAITQGLGFGTLTEPEIQLAEKIITLMPAIDMIRFTNSGTEAVMTAIRLARAYTKRAKIIKFIGGYHGHADALLVAAGSGAMTQGVPNSAGVLPTVVQDTLLAHYNQLEDVAALFRLAGEEIAAIIVEPVAGNMNCVLPLPNFLPGLRQYCDQYGSLLIFDEVMTGFRVALGGAQAYYGVMPDLTTLGKVIGGGFPIGAVGGRAALLQTLAPLGPVYQAGTFSGHPVVMAAGCAQLELVSEPGFYSRLQTNTTQLVQGLQASARAANIEFYAQSIGGMLGLFFPTNPVNPHQGMINEKAVKAQNIIQFKQFFQGMLAAGVYFAPSPFEANFLSSAHSEQVIQTTLQAAEKVFATMAQPPT